MGTDEIFEGCVRSAGDRAGVFEYDGETSSFYLYDETRDADGRIVDSIHVCSGQPDFSGSSVSIRWDAAEERVGLFIRGVVWAVFDVQRGTKYAGDYARRSAPSLPPEVAAAFRD